MTAVCIEAIPALGTMSSHVPGRSASATMAASKITAAKRNRTHFGGEEGEGEEGAIGCGSSGRVKNVFQLPSALLQGTDDSLTHSHLSQ